MPGPTVLLESFVGELGRTWAWGTKVFCSVGLDVGAGAFSSKLKEGNLPEELLGPILYWKHPRPLNEMESSSI